MHTSTEILEFLVSLQTCLILQLYTSQINWGGIQSIFQLLNAFFFFSSNSLYFEQCSKNFWNAEKKNRKKIYNHPYLTKKKKKISTKLKEKKHVPKTIDDQLQLLFQLKKILDFSQQIFFFFFVHSIIIIVYELFLQ